MRREEWEGREWEGVGRSERRGSAREGVGWEDEMEGEDEVEGVGEGGTSLPEVIEYVHILNRCVVISKEGYRLDG